MNAKKNKIQGYRAPAVQKAFEILRIVAESREELSLSDLAKSLGFSKSSTHGLVQALLKVGALDQNPQRKKFFLVELAFRSWNYLRVAEHAQPILDELRDQTAETVFLGAVSRYRGLIMATAETTKPLKISSPPGTTIPLLAGAVGKVFLAEQDDDQARILIKQRGLRQFTEHTIINENQYIAELAKVRRQGYALDNEEYLPGVRAVAVALGNHRGLPLAIWVVGFADSINDDVLPKIIQDTLNTANKLRIVLENGA
jgi:DNA-binding IclR family transcriptional regulator